MIGTVLASRYRIQSQLGEGGMAIVYKAMDILLHRIVAIKVLRPQYAGDEEFVERFRREAQAAASLSHPNVVNIFDVGEADDVHYIVLECVQGQNLKQIVRDEGRLVPRRAVRIAAAVARALQAAHERQLVHRDIKPHNILITTEGRVKVTDFGIARASSASNLTETGMVIGSVHYFSPEQARGEAVGPAADLYSLGVVLYEMLTGQVPFTGDSPVAVALKHLQHMVRPPSELVSAIPPWLEHVVMKALAKDPAQRYRSAAQMALDLVWRGDDASSSDIHTATKTMVALPTVAGDGPSSDNDPAETTGRGRGDDPTGHTLRAAVGGVEPGGFDPSHRHAAVTADDARSAIPSAVDDSAASQEDDAAGRKSNRLRRVLVTLAALLVVGVGVYAGTPLLVDVIFPPEVDVPGVTGLTYEEAQPLMRAAGLTINVEAEIFDRHVPEGAIVRQSPEAGRVVRKGREISVALSRGPELGSVPDVTGQPVRDARVLLTQAGYTLAEEIEQPDATVAANQVVSQEPLPGTELEKGSSITLWVSKPAAAVAQTVVVPDLRGKQLSAAEAELAEIGLVSGNKWPEMSVLVPPGRVIDQNPPAGAVVDVGADIDFVYSERLVGSGRGAAPPTPIGGLQQPVRQPEGDTGREEEDDPEVTDPPAVPQSPESDFHQPFEFGTVPTPDAESSSIPETGAPFAPDLDDDVGQAPRPDMAFGFGESVESEGDGAEEPDLEPVREPDPEPDPDTDWEAVLQAEAGDLNRRWANVDVYVPPGAPREVVVLVIDDFGVREALRRTVPGDTNLQQLIDGRGEQARLQVYIDGVMHIDQAFPE